MIIGCLFILQAVGGYFQVKNYKSTVHRMHKLGNLGMGQRRGRFFNGYLVVVACGNDHMIRAIEVMDGKTFLAKFHPIETLLGKKVNEMSIDEFLFEFRAMDKKKQKRYRGYIQSMEALEMRFQRQKSEEKEQETAVLTESLEDQ